MRYDALTLVKQTHETDELGVETVTETTREVTCTVSSVGRSEVFEGGRNGLNPQYQFGIFFGDYDGEDLCEFKGTRYSIYRTYLNGDYVELYAEKRKGTE